MSLDIQDDSDADETPIKGPTFDIMSDEEIEKRSNRILEMIDEADEGSKTPSEE